MDKALVSSHRATIDNSLESKFPYIICGLIFLMVGIVIRFVPFIANLFLKYIPSPFSVILLNFLFILFTVIAGFFAYLARNKKLFYEQINIYEDAIGFVLWNDNKKEIICPYKGTRINFGRKKLKESFEVKSALLPTVIKIEMENVYNYSIFKENINKYGKITKLG